MISMELIDEFRKRTHSSYEEAKFYLERNNGDLLDAIIDFERSKTGRAQHRGGYHAPHIPHDRSQQDFGHKLTTLLQKGFDTRIFVEDSKSVLFNVPVILLLFLLPFWVIIVVLFVFFMMLGYKISVRDVKSRNIDVDAIFSNISEKMKETGQPAERPVPSEPQTGDKDKKDGYKEYTIE
ncbi:DUF4342 domain-containing protein [Thermoclostridium caenicola]|uniref:Uncharacterized protein n=1 Tax=Thermoclostridium caenicola TaxID=659425 RepID=A0A1M6GA35_9FIRM|nr:DUF4342 domain-containing protein [Thermoclostridium caenicola]SHJ06813.1 protein of unknown function [Thermoclostridium caenicola]HOL85648.1 DUF4342 domain-containing protein [Thermoclostridium caenicola]HOP73092.1 DUF4342 domain-containing protein [Thermoclostridium caenicola]HPO76602.1 DUF4342 domain-containing protein [Thermoclostridium caenicola]HPU22503.1 DUF4342 domain-containing protein [Thermoclostridium caenicola]